MGWFTRIDEDVLEWQVAHWKWLIQSLRQAHDIDRIRLVQPTPVDFPVTGTTIEERATQTFRCVQKHFGLESWPCTLAPFEETADVVKDIFPVLAQPQTSKGAAGLFEVTKEKEVIIRYKPDQVGEPMAMIATMAHELCHYVLTAIPRENEPPGGWNEHEPITDLTAVFFGFGIFLANSSFRFVQWQDSQYQGWSAGRQGYLSQDALSLSLALFCACKDTDPNLASRHLSTNPRHYFWSYHKELVRRRMDSVQKLRIFAKDGGQNLEKSLTQSSDNLKELEVAHIGNNGVNMPPDEQVVTNKRPWTGLIIAIAVLIGTTMEAYDSRWYFKACFQPPIQMTFASLRDSIPANIYHNRIIVRWSQVENSGVVMKETTTDNYNGQLLERKTVAKYYELRSSGRTVIAKIDPTHRTIDYDGVILPVPADIRELISPGNPGAFEKKYCPFYIDTLYIAAKRTYPGIIVRILIWLSCLFYVAKWIKERV